MNSKFHEQEKLAAIFQRKKTYFQENILEFRELLVQWVFEDYINLDEYVDNELKGPFMHQNTSTFKDWLGRFSAVVSYNFKSKYNHKLRTYCRQDEFRTRFLSYLGVEAIKNHLKIYFDSSFPHDVQNMNVKEIKSLLNTYAIAIFEPTDENCLDVLIHFEDEIIADFIEEAKKVPENNVKFKARRLAVLFE